MAPTDQNMKNKKFKEKYVNKNKSKKNLQGVAKKRKWTPENKVFQGSVKEGQGFAFKRKEKFQHEYNKLLRKEEKKKKRLPAKALYKEEYPEHLRHLYLAEEEKLKNEAWTNRLNRSKMRLKGQKKEEEMGGNDDDDDDDAAAAQRSKPADPDPEVTVVSELTDAVAGNNEATTSSDKESLPMSNRMRKKMQKKTSYQKTKEEFEAVKERRRKKKEEFLQDKQQREEALQRYKQKKMETFKILSKKTKKGQPNLNLQMEYLLQKIQGTGK